MTTKTQATPPSDPVYAAGYTAAREAAVKVLGTAVRPQRHYESELRNIVPPGTAMGSRHREDLIAYEHAAEQMEEVLRQVQELSP